MVIGGLAEILVWTNLRVRKTPAQSWENSCTLVSFLYWKIREKFPSVLQSEEEKGTIMKYVQSNLFLLTKHASKGSILPEPNQLKLYQNPTDLEEGKYPTSSPSGFPMSIK